MKRLTWVIGGDSGIGLATAQLLLMGNQRHVMVTGRNVDVRSVGELVHRWKEITEIPVEFDRVEIVYSAGVNRLDWIGSTNLDNVQEVFDVNVIGFIRLMDFLAARGLEGVRVVVIGSDAAERPLRTSMAYCASKAALHMAARVAARELAAAGWRINVVAPGMTGGTGMTAYIDNEVPLLRGWSEEEALQYEMSQAVIKRRATPSEVAESVRMLLDGPDYINGAILHVNGGR